MKRTCISGLAAFLVLIASSAFAQFGGNSASPQTVRVTADRANLRDKPAADGAIVSSVSKGDELDVLDQAGSWYHVRAKSTGAQGYISSLLAEVVSTAPSGGASAAPRQAPAPTPRSGTPETPPAAPRPAAAQPPAATTVVEPEYSGTFTYLNPDGSLTPLEQQETQNVDKAKAGGLMGRQGGQEIRGGRSPVRLKGSPPPQFVLRLGYGFPVGGGGPDPHSLLQLFRLKANKNSRLFETSRSGSLLGSSGGSLGRDSIVVFTAASYGKYSILVTPSAELPPGEYALSNSSSTVGLLRPFLFGVD